VPKHVLPRIVNSSNTIVLTEGVLKVLHNLKNAQKDLPKMMAMPFTLSQEPVVGTMISMPCTALNLGHL
jgi:hypothetical protein